VNYYDARELRDPETGEGTGTFHFVVMNRRTGTHPVGYCAEHGGHPSAEEARECFRKYLLDDVQEEHYGDWTGCEVEGCDEPTKRGLTARRPLGNGHALCDEHRTKEHLEALMGGVGSIASSY
jgi:hypothetical protein